MEELISNGTQRETVPENYIFPEEERARSTISTCKTIPLVDLEGGSEDEISKEILMAGKEFGFFQVVNHGIPNQVLADMMNIAEEFFAMPLEDKALYFSEDPKKFPRLGTSQGRHKEKVRYWRDFLNLRVYPLEKYVHLFPEKPSNFRNILAKYTPEAKDLATRILKLISIGLGLNKDYFKGNLSGSDSFMSINYYPPCPNPKLTFGLPKHCDANLITLLLQGNISGLQILHDGEWLAVDPIPNAFVVNFGLLMEVITNGLLKAVEHRAVTNLNVARTSIFLSTNPTDDCIISPAQALVSEDHNPQLYKPFNPQEFINVFYSKEGDKMAIMEAFRLEN